MGFSRYGYDLKEMTKNKDPKLVKYMLGKHLLSENMLRSHLEDYPLKEVVRWISINPVINDELWNYTHTKIEALKKVWDYDAMESARLLRNLSLSMTLLGRAENAKRFLDSARKIYHIYKVKHDLDSLPQLSKADLIYLNMKKPN